MRGPHGFWCRHCGKYQSIRNPREVRAMHAHMAEHGTRAERRTAIAQQIIAMHDAFWAGE